MRVYQRMAWRRPRSGCRNVRQSAFGRHCSTSSVNLNQSEHAPRRHVPGRQHLVLVVPAPAVGLDHATVGGEREIGRPAVRRHVEHLDLVGIVGQKPAQAAPMVAVGLLLEPDHPGRHRQDAVLAHQADRLAVGRHRGALADQRRACARRCSPGRAGSAPSRPACRDAGCRHRARCRRRASIRPGSGRRSRRSALRGMRARPSSRRSGSRRRN